MLLRGWTVSKQKTLKEQRSFHFPKQARPIAYGDRRCETCNDQNIPSNRPVRYAVLALPLQTSKKQTIELELCEEHYLAALALSEFYTIEDENQLIQMSEHRH